MVENIHFQVLGFLVVNESSIQEKFLQEFVSEFFLVLVHKKFAPVVPAEGGGRIFKTPLGIRSEHKTHTLAFPMNY